MPGNTLLRRLGIERRNVIERATDAADTGLWLALRIDADVTAEQLATFVDRWNSADLASITDVVVPPALATAQAASDHGFVWFAEMTRLSDSSGPHPSGLHPLVPAAAKGAERLCKDLHESVVGLDDTTPANFIDPCFGARAEQDKSFVRCAKALLSGISLSRIDRVSLWSTTPRVVAACRGAARNAGLNPGDRYEVCVPESHASLAANLLREGESVRMWCAIDQAVIERAVGR